MEQATSEGYYRWPTTVKDRVVFVSEDDLWIVDLDGGVARRLSSGLGRVRTPALSPDGQWLAFSSTEEGHSEIYVMPAGGGEAERRTYLGGDTGVVGWTRAGEILFISNHQQAFARLTDVYKLDLKHHEIKKVPCGPATHADFDQQGRLVISRHGGSDLAYWKRYRGGRAGEIWIDRKGDGDFRRLLKLEGNFARPFWVGSRIFFLSDHEGIGNIYSVDDDGSDLRRHSACRDFYARGLSVSGTRLIFHSGGDLYTFDSAQDEKAKKINIDYRSPRTQLNRRFVEATDFLEDYSLHPSGERCVIAARGKTFSFDLQKGPVFQHGQEGVMRYRLGRFLKDGKRVVLVSDAGGEESLEIHDGQNRTVSERLTGLDLGRTVEMKLSPVTDAALLTNHRHELIHVDLVTHAAKVLDRSQFSPIYGFNWSSDGKWVAYSCSETERTIGIRICNVETLEVQTVTRPLLRDVCPYFDPKGDYLYFLSYREFDPVYDNLHFDLAFPRGCKPYLITLRKDVSSPFGADHKKRSDDKARGRKHSMDEKEDDGPKDLEIDFDGIKDRIVAFPVADGRYRHIAASNEKVFFTRMPIEGSLKAERYRGDAPPAKAQLESFNIDDERIETLANNITSFKLSHDGKHIIYRAGNALRVIKAGEKPGRDDEGKRSTWIDLDRVQIPVRPRSEWRQMYREAWRLQRDHFWTEDMAKINWGGVFDRYLPLLDRVSTRSEVSDLLWEMQGELGTSHAYEMGGDYRPDPSYGIGFLGVETEFSEEDGGHRITNILKGDLWDEKCSSPLARAGVNLEAGDVLLAIDGQPLTREHPPQQYLFHRAGREVSVTFLRKDEEEPQTLSVKTLVSEQRLRYREWVEANRAFVHKESGGRIGYLHIPNMGPYGYAEFHRSFLQELDCGGLIVDVRFNGGGHVSELLLEKLARRRIGYSKSRWEGVRPYPDESPAGPMVAVTNEYAGSDGDIFSHSFKLLKLGPLIGKRTWGGVIGISPSHNLVDGGYTTQPEYSFWFEDVGFRVENYGTEPDIEVEIPPAAYVAGKDPQLETAVRVCLERMERHPPKKPRFEEAPDLSIPGF